MDTIEGLFGSALAWWRAQGYDVHYWSWLAVGAVGLIIWIYVAYRFLRKALGHHKINGAWLNTEHLDAVLNKMHCKEKDGAIMSLNDLMLLEKYRPDRKIHLKRLGEAEFKGW